MALVDPIIGALFDPFIGDAVQSNRMRADVRVLVAGNDVTSKLDPHLISVRVLAGVQLEDYTAEIELDDRDGRLPIPPVNSPLQVYMGWRGESDQVVFDGVIHDIEHGFGRGQGGRRMWVHGFGATMLGHGKTPMNDHMGDGAPPGSEMGPQIPVSAFLKMVAGNAGQSITVHPFFDGQSMQRDYWQQAGESYYHLGRRLAEEMGGLFRVKAGTVGQFTIKGQNVDGTPTPTVAAVWGENLIGWRVRPMSARPAWNSTSQHFFDVQNGVWKKMQKQLNLPEPFGFAQSSFMLPVPAPNQGQAGGNNDGVEEGIGQAQGPGRIVVNGEPSAQGNAMVSLSGARPGVDGTYWCPTAEHIYSRQGYVTWLDVNAVQISGQGTTGGAPGGGPYEQYQAPQAPPTTTNPVG
jgi:uncharacterized protein